MENMLSYNATFRLSDFELAAHLRSTAETLREGGHRSPLADWCDEAAHRLIIHRVEQPHRLSA